MPSPEPDATALLDAVHFAAAKHRDQRREDHWASPFINHPIETAAILAGVGLRATAVLASAILHDVLEDTRTSAHELSDRFGAVVTTLVEELTDEPGLPTPARRERQVARVAGASSAAKQIRLADKIANLRCLPVRWSKAECDEYIAFAERVAGVVRGVSPRLDALFLTTVRRARAAAQQARPAVHAAPLPIAPAVRAADGASAAADDLRRLQRLLSRADETLDKVLMGHGPAGVHGPVVGPRAAVAAARWTQARRTCKRRFADPAFKLLAEPGIGSIEFRRAGARHVAVSIDGAKAFRLSVGIARLLETMASADGERTDGFAAWQSRREVAARLAKKTGRPYGDHAIVVAIGRLRWKLHTIGNVNPMLVETNGRNVRLRVRRSTP